MLKFLHTADWQLGMTRHFLNEGVQERFTQARFDSIRKLGQIAKEEECQFIVVAGDVFDSNALERTTVSRSLEAMKDVGIPIYLLPGNHDPLDAISIYTSKTFLDRKPANVHVLDSNAPILIENGVEIIGVPWSSKRPLNDLVAEAIDNLEPTTDTVRILVGHGIVDRLSPNIDDPAVILLDRVDAALKNKLIHFVALGDRHSLTNVGESGRVWYSGAPEPTAYDEQEPGMAIITTIDGDSVSVKEVPVAQWKFIERKGIDLNQESDLDDLRTWLDTLEDKERTVLKLRFVGTASLTLHSQLEELLDHYREISAALQVRERDLVIIPDDADFDDLGFSGFVNSAVEELRSRVERDADDSATARESLALLVRLAGTDK